MVAPAAVQVVPPQDGGAPQVVTQTQPLPPTMIQYPMGYPTSYPVNPQYAPLQRGWEPTRGGQGRQPPQRPAWGAEQGSQECNKHLQQPHKEREIGQANGWAQGFKDKPQYHLEGAHWAQLQEECDKV
ncbi:hypothetical protein Q7C36_005198 [Tachysurus vachellii]|uniref:Uncharacterized protein n=1 Tax=Tachysurus vachellii TaxID=175792 RepID=A0AA88T4U7_TACVA|nr:hypothetical protein Q7C36_005198 [Tachysurus vachellii]